MYLEYWVARSSRATTIFGMELSLTGLRLIGDIGGTNARFAIAEGGKYRQLKHVENEHYPSLHDAMEDYLKALPQAERTNLAGALAIAGPVLGDRISLTNKAWSFSIEDLKQSLHLTTLAVVNDFAANAHAIPHLTPQQKFAIGPAIANPHGNIGVVGPGTGLGMSSLIPNGDGWTLVVGEGGHATLAASTEEEFAIIQMLWKRWSHVSAERVLSGAGLVNLYEALCAIRGIEPLMLSPADVTRRAMDKSDEICVRAFDRFCEIPGQRRRRPCADHQRLRRRLYRRRNPAALQGGLCGFRLPPAFREQGTLCLHARENADLAHPRGNRRA